MPLRVRHIILLQIGLFADFFPSGLNALSRAVGEEVDTQNVHIGRIIGKTDKVDDQIAMNRARLDRIT